MYINDLTKLTQKLYSWDMAVMNVTFQIPLSHPCYTNTLTTTTNHLRNTSPHDLSPSLCSLPSQILTITNQLQNNQIFFDLILLTPLDITIPSSNTCPMSCDANLIMDGHFKWMNEQLWRKNVPWFPNYKHLQTTPFA